MEKFVVLVNGGLWEGGKVFVGLESVKEMFKGEGIEKWIIDGDEFEFDEGIDELLSGGDGGYKLEVGNEELCEMGDDFCELSICKLVE